MHQHHQRHDSASDIDQVVAVMLEIQGEEAQGTMRLPVSVQGTDIGQVVLRLSHSLPEFMWESLVKLNAKLYLAVPEEPEIMEVPGKVAWLKVSGTGRPQTLALELSQPHPKFQKLLRQLIAHAPADIKELWQRWDQAKDQDPAEKVLNYHVGLGLMLGGIVVNLAGPKTGSYFMASYLFMFLGGLVAGVKNLMPLRWKRARSL
jgi:hypothetical protein